MWRSRDIEAALRDIRTEQQQLRAAQEHDLREARARTDRLQAQLVDEQRRVRELSDQVAHLIDELGEARRLWHEAEAALKAERES